MYKGATIGLRQGVFHGIAPTIGAGTKTLRNTMKQQYV